MKKRIAALFITLLMMLTVLCAGSTVAFAKTNLKITKQPVSVKVLSGQEAKVTVKAKGDGLTYKWYYKNKGAKKYSLSKSVKSRTYSVKMKSSADGRKIYCVVTDKYGNTEKTKTVTLKKGTAVKLTKKPASATADCGDTAKVKVSAKGDGLTYKWYYKNKGDNKYTLSKNAKTSTYSVKMKSSADGRRLYCVITDAYGKKVKTDSVKLTLKHVYNSGKVTKKATCTSTGTKVYTCKVCDATKKETLAKTSHSYEGWKVYNEATVTANGTERNKCKNCGYYKDRSTDKLKAVYYITLNTGTGKAEKVGVASDGKYSLKAPYRAGYNFIGWKDASGNDFPASGVYKNNATLNAQWELDGTNTLAELVERTDAGVKEIKITGDITVNQPLFISTETNIYSDGDYTIRRNPSYRGDIFVVGRDRNGKMAAATQKKAVLNLGAGAGTLTIDGNRDNLKVDVVGSALFVADSSVVNIFDGVRIINNKKTGNERGLAYKEDVTGSIVEKAGGAAVLVLNSTVNIYGGEISNNIVKTEYTITTDEDGKSVYNETDGCGGAIFNLGNINMYGGTVSGNEALRGGGIYSARILYLISGKISDNTGYAYGGGVASSSGADADTFIGSVEGPGEMIFENNHGKTGGALYSNTSSPIIILGNARFDGNSSSSGGGAIYTAGSLTVRGSVFENNSAIASGGAIYHHYTKESFERRLFELTDCSFKNNSASLGGAVALSASDSVAATGLGTYATVTGCEFTGNKAVKTESNVGNGGAIYVTRKSEAIIKNCSFAQNVAVNNAGAVAVQSASKVQLSDSSFADNQGVAGGGVYSAAGTTLTMKNIQFTGNKAVKKESGSEGNGGALYIYDSAASFNNVDFADNSAENHAGAVYLAVSDISIDSTCSFTGNSAANHGGAFYLTYKTISENTRDGAVLNATGVTFENNSALAGGAISARSDCTANLDSVTLKGNSVEGYANKADGDGEGGGAIYVGYGSLTLTDVTATGNTASDFGGVVDSAGSVVTVNGGSFTGNTSNTGGVLYACAGSEVTVNGALLSDNESVYVNSDYNNAIGGGAISTKNGKLNISGVTFDGNKSDYYGGAVHANKTDVTINGNTAFVNSQGGTGAALCLINSCNTTLENISVNNNTSTANGVVYASGGTLTMKNIAATGNKANNGGILYTSGSSTVVDISNNVWKGNTASSGGIAYITNATANITDCTFEENTAYNGGVAYVKGGILNTSNVKFNNNSAIKKESGSAGNGGAVYMESGTFNSGVNESFTGNSAANHGGALYVTYLENKDTGEKTGAALGIDSSEFIANTSKGNGGAVYLSRECEVNAENAVFTSNEAVNGGAMYVSTDKAMSLTGVDFEANKSTSNGGALAVYDAELTVKDTDFVTNTSGNHGGAVYICGNVMNVDADSLLKGNAAGNHGGAVYVVYKTNDDKTKTGAVLNATGTVFEGNSALGGGAVSVRTDCTANLDGAALTANSTEGFAGKNDGDGEGGGAIYVGFGDVNLINVTATGNEAKESLYVNDENEEKLYGFGGFIDAYCADVSITGGVISGNKAPSGGAVNMFGSGSTLAIDGTALTNNESTYLNGDYDNSKGGGALNISNATVTISNADFDGNSTKWYGGAVIASGSDVTIEKSTFTNSKGATGAAVNFKSGSDVTITDTQFNNNTSTYNGVLYANSTTITMNSVTATGNKAVNGGLIYTSGASTAFDINNSTFTANSAANGGVAFTENATLKFTDCTISDNTATSNGGVVFSKEGSSANVQLIDCEVSGNSAKSGGVVYAEKGADIDVSGTEFTENTASSNGGAIYTEEAADLTVNASAFDKNYSKSNGGAIHAYRTAVTLIDSTFTENSTDAHGGAINNVGSVITATGNNEFASNTAAKHGGAIYVTYIKAADATETEPAVEAAVGVINFTGGSFTANTAMAGGAFSVRTGCVANLTDTVLTGNSVVGYADKNDGDGEGGGAIYVGFGDVNLINVTATGNEAKESLYVNDNSEEKLYGFGGFIDAYCADVSITGGVFSGNKAPSGGAVNIVGSGNTLTVSAASFEDNEASYINNEHDNTKGGGAVYFKNGELNISNTVFDNNASGFYGGAVMASGAKVSVDASTAFTGNTGATGAALYFINSCTATIENTSFVNNSVNSNGGAVYANGSTVNMTNVTATGNNATNGGVLYTSGASSVIEISDSVLNSNSAVTGGVVYMTDASVSIEGCELKENTAQIGGAVYNSRGTLNLSDNDFISNSAILNSQGKNGNGAAISIAGGNVNADGTNIFSNNTAAGHGGAIYVAYATKTDETKIPGVLTMGADVLENNSAMGGGAISVRTECEANLTGTVLTGNSANGYANENDGDGEQGGAVYVGYGSLSMTNVTATGNSASDFGGVVNAVSSTATVNGGTFENNSSTGEGGAIYIKGTTKLTVTDATFKANTAKGKGGAISTAASSPNLAINATGCTFEGNTSTTAGAGAVEIQCRNCNSATDPEKVNIVFTDCTFKNNEAKTTGGAVEIRTNSCAKFDGITATGNKAAANGAVIYVTSNFSRVYVTGEVNLSGNAGNGGKDSTFIHLYNSNYSNPPRIYTTYGENAPWYTTALIGGNRTSITFNMSTLP